MAKIVFLSLVFPPDSVSTALLMGELAHELRKKGHDLTILTTTPHYNRDPEAESVQRLEWSLWPFLKKSRYYGIPVYHILMPPKASSPMFRIVPLLAFHVLSLLTGVIVLRKPDIIIVPSPPITLGLCGWVLSRFHKAKYIYNVQEIYPDCAINLGVLRNRPLIRILYMIEAFVYDRASAVSVIAPHMAERLLQKHVPNGKIHMIPNFVDLNNWHPLPKDNSFSRQHNVHDKFLVSYAGNMGPAQNLETFIDCAALIPDNLPIHFMMMGGGMLREKLRLRTQKMNLPNLHFLPFQPASQMNSIYAASDLCLVPLVSEITGSAIPSKVYRIMACARPILAAAERKSDLSELVDEARCGIVVKPGSPEEMAKHIIEVSKTPKSLRAMGEAGRQHVEKQYSLEAVTRQYDTLINNILQKDRLV